MIRDRLVGRLVGHLGRLPDAVAQPRFNIAPTQRVLAVVNEDPPALMRLRWGLVPPWSVTPDAGRLSTFNVRIETIATSRLCCTYGWRRPGRQEPSMSAGSSLRGRAERKAVWRQSFLRFPRLGMTTTEPGPLGVLSA